MEYVCIGVCKVKQFCTWHLWGLFFTWKGGNELPIGHKITTLFNVIYRKYVGVFIACGCFHYVICQVYRPIFPFHARVIPLINGFFWSNHVKKGNNWKICWLLGHKNFYRKIMKWKKKVSVFIWCTCLFMQLLRLCFFKSVLLLISQQWIFMM